MGARSIPREKEMKAGKERKMGKIICILEQIRVDLDGTRQ